MNLVDPVRELAARAPGVPALVLGERRLDRAGLDAAASAAAAGLAAAGLRPGMVVAVVPAADRVLHVVTVLALARSGIVHLPIGLQEPLEQVTWRMRIAGADAVVGERSPHDLKHPLVRPDPVWLHGTTSDPAPDVADAVDRPWIIAASSGSTGRPKSIAITHAMELARNRRDRQFFAHGEGEPFLTLIEPGFYNSTSATLRCLGQGGTVVLDHQFGSLAALLETVRQRSVRFLQMTPSHLFALVEALPDGPPALPDLRVLRISSAALPVRILDLTRRRLADRVHLTYGTNEAGTLAVATPELLAADPVTVGRPLAGIDFEIVDGEDRPIPAERLGFVRVRGPGVMAGYLGDEAATGRHCRNGWFHPGDMAARGADGLIRLKGRSDRTLNVGGILVAAEAVETALLSHPAVGETVVVAVASERFQVVPLALVVLRAAVDMAELAAHVRASIPALPLMLRPVPALPRNAMGKIDHPAAERMAAAGRERSQPGASAGNNGRSRS